MASFFQASSWGLKVRHGSETFFGSVWGLCLPECLKAEGFALQFGFWGQGLWLTVQVWGFTAQRFCKV